MLTSGYLLFVMRSHITRTGHCYYSRLSTRLGEGPKAEQLYHLHEFNEVIGLRFQTILDHNV